MSNPNSNVSVTREGKTIFVRIDEKIVAHELLATKKINDKFKGRQKVRSEHKKGHELHRDSKIWRSIDRLIDRENNRYMEVVKDIKKGEVLHFCHEPLTEHYGHGNAKKFK